MANDDDGVPVVLRILIKKDQQIEQTTREVKEAIEQIFDVKIQSDPLQPIIDDAKVAKIFLDSVQDSIRKTFGADNADSLETLEAITRDLQIWQGYNTTLLKQNPELRDAYRGTYAEAKARVEELNDALQKLAKAEAAAARETATAQKQAATEAKAALDTITQAQQEATKAAEAASRAAARATQVDSQLIQQLGNTISVAMAAAGASLLGVAGAALKTAADFETMEVRLVALKGSAEAAARSLELIKQYGSNTGFELKGLEQATIKLEQFGLKSEEVLGTVANLAAAKGKTIEGTAQILGLVAEGDERVFRTLARQYQITATDLKAFGGVVDETTGKVVNNTEVAQQNVAALQRLVASRYGDAAAKQADTLNGAMNQAKNAVTGLSEAFGKELEPFAISAFKIIKGAADVTNTIMTPAMKELAIVSAVVGGAMLALAASGTFLATKLFAVNVQLEVMSKNSTLAATALTRLQGVQNFVSGGMASLARFTLGVVTSVGGLVAILTALAAYLGTREIDAYADAQKNLGDQIEGASKKAQEQAQEFHKVLDIVEKLAQKHDIQIDLKGDAKSQLTELGKLANKVGAEDFASAFAKAGYTSERFSEELKKLNDDAKTTEEKMKALKTAIDLLQVPGNDTNGLGDNFGKIQESLRKVGLGALAANPNVKSLKDTLLGLQVQSQETSASIGILQTAFAAFKQFIVPLQEAEKAAGKLKDFLKYAEQIDSVQSLGSALSEVEKQLTNLGNLPGIKGLSKEDLVQKLKADNVEDVVKANIKAYLDYDKEKDHLVKLEAKRRDDDVKDLEKHEDTALAYQREAGQATLRDELALVKQQIARRKEASDEKLALIRREKALEKQIPEDDLKKDELQFRHLKTLQETSLQDELKFVQDHIQAFAEGTEQRVRLEEQAQHLIKQIQEKAVKDAKAALQGQYENARQVVDQVKNDAEHTPAQAIKAIDGVIDALHRWKDAHGPVLVAGSETLKLYDSLIRTTNASRASEVAKQEADNLRILKESITNLSASAIGESNKLLAVEREIELTKRAQTAHLITQKQAEEVLTGLSKQKLQIEERITEQRAQQAIKIMGLDLQNRAQEIQSLEKRQERGEKVGEAIKRDYAKQLQDRLRQVDLEKAEEIRRNGSSQEAIENANRESAFKRTEIIRAETEREVEEYEKRRKALEDSKKPRKELGFSGFNAFHIDDFGQDVSTSARYARGNDSAFLGDKDQLGQQFGDDDSPAALYKRIFAQVLAKSGNGPTVFNPTPGQAAGDVVNQAAVLAGGGQPFSLGSLFGTSALDPLAALKKAGALNPGSIISKQNSSVIDPAYQAAMDNAFRANAVIQGRGDWHSNGNAANGLPGGGVGANPVAQGAAMAAKYAEVHIHIDGNSSKVEERDIIRVVMNWLESEGRLRGNNHPPVS